MSDPNATQTVYDGLTHSPTWPTKICGPNLVEVLNAAGFYQKKEWVGLTDEILLDISKDAWGRNKLHISRSDHTGFYIDFGRAVEAKLKQKNA